MKFVGAVALLWSFAGLALAVQLPPGAPEIDGALAIQAISLLGGVLYLLKRKK